MKIFLFLVGIVSYLGGVLAFFAGPTSIQETLGAVILVNGTVALAGASILERLEPKATDGKPSELDV